MNKSVIITIVVVLLLIVGGGMVIANQQSQKQAEEAKMSQEKATMKAKEDEAMKMKEDAAMKEKDTMEKDKAMDDGKDEGAMMGIGYILKNGKMMIDSEGKMSAMTQDVTLKNGTVVSTTGVVTKKDGTTIQLKEGQSIWPDGSIVDEKTMMKEKEGAAMEK